MSQAVALACIDEHYVNEYTLMVIFNDGGKRSLKNPKFLKIDTKELFLKGIVITVKFQIH